MSHFQRSAYQVAQHFTHDYPGAPLRVHPVQPLMPMEVSYSGYGAYGYNWDKAAKLNRKFQTTLRSTGANLAVYDLYDAVNHLDDMTGEGRYLVGMNDIRAISSYSSMATLAANDSSAMLKSAYWVKLAGLLMVDSSLIAAGDEIAENGYRYGEQPGAASLNNRITSLYQTALDLVKGSSKYASRSASPNVKLVVDNLQKGTGRSVVRDRVKEAGEEEEAAKKNIPTGSGGSKPEEPDAKCEDSWKSYIPGLCTAEAAGDMLSLAVKVVGGVAVAGVVFWGAKKVIRGAKSVKDEAAANPRRMLTTRSNPSAPGRTDYGPEEEIAQMPKARVQEQAMMKNVFKRKV